jgi:hypothetical protein
MPDMCCLVLAGPRERLSWRLSLFPRREQKAAVGYEVMSRLIALRCVQTKRDTSRLALGVKSDPTEMSAPSGMAKGIVILNKVPVSLLPSR